MRRPCSHAQPRWAVCYCERMAADSRTMLSHKSAAAACVTNAWADIMWNGVGEQAAIKLQKQHVTKLPLKRGADALQAAACIAHYSDTHSDMLAKHMTDTLTVWCRCAMSCCNNVPLYITCQPVRTLLQIQPAGVRTFLNSGLHQLPASPVVLVHGARIPARRHIARAVPAVVLLIPQNLGRLHGRALCARCHLRLAYCTLGLG